MQQFIVNGREKHYKNLVSLIDLAKKNQAGVAFVVGEAGSGKTTLIEAFCNYAISRDQDSIFFWGQCSTPYGNADPYLPIKDIYSQFLGDFDNFPISI